MDYIRLDIQTKDGHWHNINLSDDVSIDIQETTPLWGSHSGGAFSYPFTIDIDDNLPFFGNTGEGHGESIIGLLMKRPFRLYLDGNMFKAGIVKIEEDIEIQIEDSGHRTVEINLESSLDEFDEVLDGVKVRDLNIGDLQIGYCLPDRLKFTGTYKETIYNRAEHPVSSGWYEYTNEVSTPKMCIVNYHDNQHNGQYTHNFTNVQFPYNPNNPYEHPYCHVRACYKKNVPGDDFRTVGADDHANGHGSWKDERGYGIGEPDRINSAPCFYFGFVHDETFRQLGLTIESNALNDLLDYRRLAFWHTNCAYKPVAVEGATFAWSEQQNNMTCNVYYRSGRQYNFTANGGGNKVYSDVDEDTDWFRVYRTGTNIYPQYQLCRAIATTENLPDIEAKDLVEAMESAFGARYLYDASAKSVKVILVRDVLKTSAITRLDVEVTGDIVKTETSKRGFVLKYSSSSEAEANSFTKADNIAVAGDDGSNVVADADTTYNYNDFRNPYVLGRGYAKYNKATGELEYSPDGTTEFDHYEDAPAQAQDTSSTDNVITNFDQMMTAISSQEMRLFLDPNTGNAYRIKVDGDATTQSEWFPSLFQVAAFRDVKMGDCSDEDRVETVSIPFTPVVPNDTNFAARRDARLDSKEDADNLPTPIYAQYVDGEIHHMPDDRWIWRQYAHNGIVITTLWHSRLHFSQTACHVDVNFDVDRLEDYEDQEGGPYNQQQPTFSLGIMRGSGSDAHTATYDENYDGEGHSRYTTVQGTDAEFTADTMDCYGNMYDYNGNGGGVQVISKADARKYLLSFFPDSNADLVGVDRNLSASAFRDNGWSISPGGSNYLITVIGLTDYDNKTYYFIATPVKNDGTIMDRGDFDVYLREELFEDYTYKSILWRDGNTTVHRAGEAAHYGEQVIVGRYDTFESASRMAQLYQELMAVMWGSEETGSVNFPDTMDNGLGYSPKDLISLKLKTEIPIDGDPKKGYYPITNSLAQGRGLADKFYGAYIHWLLNSKTATIPCIMSASQLRDIDWFTRYDIHGYIGFVYKKSYRITQEGIKDIKIEQKYL